MREYNKKMDIYLVLLLLVAILLTLYYYQDKIFGSNETNNKKKHTINKNKNKKHTKSKKLSESDSSKLSDLPNMTEQSELSEISGMSDLSLGSNAKNKLFDDTEIDLSDMDSKQSYESDNTFGTFQSGLSKGDDEEEQSNDSPLSMMD